MRIDEPDSREETAPVWRLAFRAGFLLAAAFAVAGMARWLGWMVAPAGWGGPLPPHWWHAHEMVFGFTLPAIAGFLLTAVATWTDIPGTGGNRLRLLFGLWLLARLLLWLWPAGLWLAGLAELSFLAIAGFELTRRVWARRQWRNMLFPPVLLALAVLDLASHASVADPLRATRIHYGALWAVAVVVVIIAGRVTPLFTGNRLGLHIPPNPPWVEYLAIGSTALTALAAALLSWHQAGPWLYGFCLAAAVLHLYRMARWRGWKTFRVPLLWSMHLSYLCIPLGLAGLALAGGDPVAVRNAMHLPAVGAVGGMILAMMSRVSLGHTGRPLEVPAYMAVAFASVILAALVRTLAPLATPQLTTWSWKVSALLWIVAFGCFLLRYAPILTRPRADGKPG